MSTWQIVLAVYVAGIFLYYLFCVICFHEVMNKKDYYEIIPECLLWPITLPLFIILSILMEIIYRLIHDPRYDPVDEIVSRFAIMRFFCGL